MKRFFSVLICAAVIFAYFILPPQMAKGADYESDLLNKIFAYPPEELGELICDVQILGCSTDTENGIFYGVTSGPPAIFFAYNLNTEAIEYETELKYTAESGREYASKVSYAVDLGNDGYVYIATQSDCLFFRYNTATKELTSYGNVFSETATMGKGCFDSNGNYYFGTYPNAKLIKYNKSTDAIEDLGRMIDTGYYLRATGSYGNKIFMGGMGANISDGKYNTQFAKYDAETGVRTIIPNPSLEGVFEESDVENYYSISTAGKYLFARCMIHNIGKYYFCVFDMEKEKWIDFIEGTSHLHPTDFVGNVVYYHNTGPNGKGVWLYTYNPATKEKTAICQITSTYLVSPALVTLNNQTKYPGKTLVAGGNNNGLVLINLGAAKPACEFIKDDRISKQYTTIRTLKSGINNELIISAYMGSKFIGYDTLTKSVKYEGSCTQIENIEVIDNKYYFGLYGSDAGMREYDPSLPPSSSNPKLISKMTGANQDRAFNIVDGGENIIWGAYPDYGCLGGAISIYNKSTKKTTGIYPLWDIENHPDYASNGLNKQCIAGLAYRNGKIYASTSVYGGLGSVPEDAPAHIFIMDMAGNIEKCVEVRLETDANTQYFVGDMIFDDQGKLWVACVKTLLKVDPETLEILKEIPIGAGTNALSTTRALPYVLEFGENGLLYTDIGRQITAIDTKTEEIKKLSSVATNALTVCEDGNLYFISPKGGKYLGKMEIDYLEGSGTEEDPYIIDSGEKFASIFGSENTNYDMFGKHYLQTADITLPQNYQPVKTTNVHFTGTYRGDQIYRVIDIGNREDAPEGFTLFNSILGGAKISDIHIKGKVGNGSYGNYGGFAYILRGTLEYCKSSVEFRGTTFIGGLARDARGIIRNCIFDGSISSTGYCGGIAAVNYDGTGTAGGIYNCIVSGSLGAGAGELGGFISVVGYGATASSKYTFSIKNNLLIGDITSGGRMGGVLSRLDGTKPGTVTCIAENNFIARPSFTVSSLPRNYAMALAGNNANEKYVKSKTFTAAADKSVAYYPSDTATTDSSKRITFVSDISALTGASLPAALNNGEWAYFPEDGNKDFKFPQLISNPWTEDIPAFMETAFGAASIPSVSGQTENGYPWVVISTSSDDTALGFEIKISDNSGNELGKLQTTEKKVSLENYIPSQGIYKISVRALGGYKSFESAYSNEYVYDYSVTLPNELITVEPVYGAKDGEIYNYQNIAYNKFAVAAAQAEPVRFYEVTEYGMLINSEYDTDINNYLKKAVGSDINNEGKFAILIHGGGIPHQKIYFIRPYAKYSGVNEGIVYGRTQIFILK